MGESAVPTSQRRRMAAAAAVAVLAVTAGCGGSSDTAQQRTATTTPAGRVDLGVVAVTARIGGDRVQSSGVVLDAGRGLVLTTAHGVWGARSLKVSTGIAVLHGRIVARDACDDLAVLETQPRLPGLVAVRPSADGTLLTGRPIVAARRRSGLPSRGPELLTQRVTVKPGAAPALLPGLRAKRTMTLEGALPAAASGAPLLGADGRLAGMAQVVQRRGRTVRAALPWDAIGARLRELKPGGRAQYVGWRRHYGCQDVLHRYPAARPAGYRRGDAQLNAPVPATRLRGTEDVDR
jgi:S1-C subfamily serine protease